MWRYLLWPATEPASLTNCRLTPRETDRLAQLSQDSTQYQQFCRSRLALRVLLLNIQRQTEAYDSTFKLVYGRTGVLRRVQADKRSYAVSIAHCRDASIVAIKQHNEINGDSADTYIGVDIEPCNRDIHWQRLSKRFHADEYAYIQQQLTPDAARTATLQLWAEKEALAKALGIGIIDILSQSVADTNDRYTVRSIVRNNWQVSFACAYDPEDQPDSLPLLIDADQARDITGNITGDITRKITIEDQAHPR